ncbi:MAG: DUF3562 domain-containing protein [Pseudorhodobacter sp.]|nr:DUF3562 domain-containing protein [Rhizobacter sp.]
MLCTEKKFALATRALELMSRKFNVPQSEVTRLYERELAGLTSDARITSFIPIFAMRNVEETLNHQHTAAVVV